MNVCTSFLYLHSRKRNDDVSTYKFFRLTRGLTSTRTQVTDACLATVTAISCVFDVNPFEFYLQHDGLARNPVALDSTASFNGGQRA